MADADVQFKAMDLDHDGFITASELTKYRAQFDFDPSLGFALERENRSGSQVKTANEHDAKAPDWARSRWTPDSSDPVMSADRSLKFKVSHDDFIAQAAETFAKLDAKHDGLIPKERLLDVCPSDAPPESHSWF
jgi:Ca2+-binding EF-hand superfamily protein